MQNSLFALSVVILLHLITRIGFLFLRLSLSRKLPRFSERPSKTYILLLTGRRGWCERVKYIISVVTVSISTSKSHSEKNTHLVTPGSVGRQAIYSKPISQITMCFAELLFNELIQTQSVILNSITNICLFFQAKNLKKNQKNFKKNMHLVTLESVGSLLIHILSCNVRLIACYSPNL